ncbi:MAG: hypothetical protein Kow0068_12620 [Marinilabiliales bacterium]
MKLILITYVLLVFSLIAYGQEKRKVSYDNLEMIDGIAYVKGEKTPFTGFCFKNHENGQIGMGGNFVNGKREGEWVWWYKTGVKQRYTQYKDGKKDGKCIWYYKNGQKKSEITFVENQNVKQLSWNKAGQRIPNPSFSSFSD